MRFFDFLMVDAGKVKIEVDFSVLGKMMTYKKVFSKKDFQYINDLHTYRIKKNYLYNNHFDCIIYSSIGQLKIYVIQLEVNLSRYDFYIVTLNFFFFC